MTDYVVGQRLLPHDGDAEVTIAQNQLARPPIG